MNNSVCLKQYPRQPHVTIRIQEANGGDERVFDHTYTHMGLFACQGITVLELMIFNSIEATEPVSVIAIPNPLSITLEGAKK